MGPISNTEALTHLGVWNQISGPSQLLMRYICIALGGLDQRSSCHRRVCIRGVTIARAHLYGKGRASVGLVTTAWVMETELALSAIAGHKLQLHHATPLHRL